MLSQDAGDISTKCASAPAGSNSSVVASPEVIVDAKPSLFITHSLPAGSAATTGLTRASFFWNSRALDFCAGDRQRCLAGRRSAMKKPGQALFTLLALCAAGCGTSKVTSDAGGAAGNSAGEGGDAGP